jgi:hypothetical protein
MAGPYIPGRADKGNLDRWSKYASDNSYRPTRSEMGGGAPRMQGSTGRMHGRDTAANCGKRAEYAGAKDDLNNG